ncbi:hypothetical protein LUZ60_003450 [Juncus effusus]|nr:hypothetical protein LUZ60_003436 [Juncus effusus]KAJ3676038.1 hypothetical protein LUZ60_003450 [Juncus effusus]
MTHAYGEASYWDERYRKESGPFDWYQKYEALAPLLRLHLRPAHRILLAGCGNSVFGERMVDDGYQEVINVDISSVLIESMQKKYKDIPQLKYMKMDVRDMKQFENRSFDAVIDKGTLDSIMCGHDSQENAKKMLEEVFRVLKEKGVYIMITYGDPSYRLRLLRDIKLWNIKMHVIDRLEEKSMWDITKPLPLNESGSSFSAYLGLKPDVHYIYICTKDGSLREDES